MSSSEQAFGTYNSHTDQAWFLLSFPTTHWSPYRFLADWLEDRISVEFYWYQRLPCGKLLILPASIMSFGELNQFSLVILELEGFEGIFREFLITKEDPLHGTDWREFHLSLLRRNIWRRSFTAIARHWEVRWSLAEVHLFRLACPRHISNTIEPWNIRISSNVGKRVSRLWSLDRSRRAYSEAISDSERRVVSIIVISFIGLRSVIVIIPKLRFGVALLLKLRARNESLRLELEVEMWSILNAN